VYAFSNSILHRPALIFEAWWDYGYQITAIANRTTLADGNTWNHEHIALLGKAFTTDLDEGWAIVRHLADYMLIWAGGRGDDRKLPSECLNHPFVA
jgi:asparagine N-glycosylation enzyme membrane subunit Stt3